MGARPNTQLTSTELEAFDVYRRFVARHRAAPSVRQFATLLGCQPSWAWRLMRAFEAKGAHDEGRKTQVRVRRTPRKRET